MPLFGKGQQFSQFGKSQRPSRIEIKKVSPLSQEPLLPKRKTLFEEKNEWSRQELKKRIEQSKPFIPGAGGEIYTHQERKKMLEEVFPQRRFSGHISKEEAKTRLRELRREEYKVKTYGEKTKISRLRQYLEGETGLKGKY